MSETITPQAPDFLSLAKEGGKGVGERQKEWAARTAPPGTVPIVLTEALQTEARLKAELASAEADIQRGIKLTDRWKALLRRRDLLASHVKHSQECLTGLNDPLLANPGLDNMIEAGTPMHVLYLEFVKLVALPGAREYLIDFTERKTAQLAQAQADIESFGKEHKINL